MKAEKPPIFLLGVGAQKAGTSWLNTYLRSLPEVDLGFMKEYHVFDQGYVEDTTPPPMWRLRQYFRSFTGTDPKSLRFKFRRNHKHYFDYFQNLVSGQDPAVITGDITPAYAALPEFVFSNLKGSLEKRGFRVKVIFLMRDPVNRCASASRMYFQKELLANLDKPFLEADLLARNFREPKFVSRTRYDSTITNLERVFDSQDIYYGFFEELFNDDSISKLCEFLDLPFRPGRYAEPVNPTKIRSVVPLELRREMTEYYADVYNFVFAKFGAERIRDLWGF